MISECCMITRDDSRIVADMLLSLKSLILNYV